MKLSVEVDTQNEADARVIAEGLFRLAQCAAEGTKVEARVNGRKVDVRAVETGRPKLRRRRAWQVNAG